MSVIINDKYIEKANALKKELKTRTVKPEFSVEFAEDENSWQKLKRVNEQKIEFPVTLNTGDSIILDFGEHIVGYIDFVLENDGLVKITDSPVNLRFSFGEFPLEIVASPEKYKGGLGSGWLQDEVHSVVFTPYTGTLNRRFAFRYLEISRTDTARVPVKITSLTARAVSSADVKEAKPFECDDEMLNKIYRMSVNTLKECEQDVFEDGPKRDRRLWIGDLKLQAMSDYKVFGNTDLIKRCIYLFASATGAHGRVAPCIFPDSPPYVDEWTFCDYSLFFISCLYDWYKNTGDTNLIKELFDIAHTQMEKTAEKFDKETGKIDLNPFIDWCPELDKSTAILGVYIYTLKQLKTLCRIADCSTDKTEEQIKYASECLLKRFDKEKGLFLSESGQISYHSQVWAVLSGILSQENAVKLLENIKNTETDFTMRTPYMMHYYIEALVQCGLKAQALEFIKDKWGKMSKAGFDCCPEVFNEDNEFESPYNAPEINSACHAWSCTPAYWIPELT